MLNSASSKKLPAFITETGWSDKKIPDSVLSKYYSFAFSQIWEKDKDKIVAITPFLLNAGGEPFAQFSFFKNGQEKETYKALILLPKEKGDPQLKASSSLLANESKISSIETFGPKKDRTERPFSPFVQLYFKTIFGLN